MLVIVLCAVSCWWLPLFERRLAARQRRSAGEGAARLRVRVCTRGWERERTQVLTD